MQIEIGVPWVLAWLEWERYCKVMKVPFPAELYALDPIAHAMLICLLEHMANGTRHVIVGSAQRQDVNLKK